MTRYVMVIDNKLCLGCNACTLSCKIQNGTPPGVFWCRVHQKEIGAWPNANREFISMPCMHCGNAPCVDVCPTGATTKRPDGIVVVDYDKCIGCRYCETACPYGSRTYITAIKSYFPEKGLTPYEAVMYKKHQVGVEEKCTFCADLVAKGEQPACVVTCPSYARFFGDIEDPSSEVSRLIAERHGRQLLPELGTDPSVWYLPA